MMLVQQLMARLSALISLPSSAGIDTTVLLPRKYVSANPLTTVCHSASQASRYHLSNTKESTVRCYYAFIRLLNPSIAK